MKKQRKYYQIFRLIRDLLICVLVGFLITYLLNPNLELIFDSIIPGALYSMLVGGMLWKGNELLSRLAEEKIQWKDKPERKFLVLILIMVVYTFIAIIAANFIWHVFWFNGEISTFKMPSLLLVAILMGVTFIISFTIYIKGFFAEKKEILIREEKLKTEIIKLEYETLKNQVNPHFLFNSLNALTSLVADNEEAVKFIRNLADVYRYVLEQKDKEIVSMDCELGFAYSYLYLLQIRFGSNLQFNICKPVPGKMVVPLAVQMLVENAIKHNEIMAETPLKISIFTENDYLVVENNLQIKYSVNDSSKIGLGNIRSRYSYLTDKEIFAGPEPGKYIVKLPLLEFRAKS